MKKKSLLFETKIKKKEKNKNGGFLGINEILEQMHAELISANRLIEKNSNIFESFRTIRITFQILFSTSRVFFFFGND